MDGWMGGWLYLGVRPNGRSVDILILAACIAEQGVRTWEGLGTAYNHGHMERHNTCI